MTCSRWIRVCVDMLDHPVVGASVPPPKPHDPSRHAIQPALAWLDMISAAAWKTREVPHKDKIITLQRGEFLAGRAYWAKRWNWGEQAVRSFFARLAKFEMIVISNQSLGHTANVVRICNYDIYQGAKTDSQPEEKPEPNQRSTSAQPEGNQTVYRDTKDTKDKNNSPTERSHQDAAREAEHGFDGKLVQLSVDEVRSLARDFPRLAFPGDLIAADRFLAAQINGHAALMTRDGKFARLTTYLAKKNREAREVEEPKQQKPKSKTMALLDRLQAEWAEEAAHA